jgi:hypothetical protein
LVGVQQVGGKGVLRASPIQAPDGTRYLYGTTASNLTTDTRHIVLARLGAPDRIDPAFGAKGLMVVSTARQDLSFAATFSADNTITIAGGAFSKSDFGEMSEELFTIAV